MTVVSSIIAALDGDVSKAGKSIALGVGGGLAVLLGLEWVGVLTIPLGIALFLFEVGLVATLQAFIFATLSSIYLGGAVAESH